MSVQGKSCRKKSDTLFYVKTVSEANNESIEAILDSLQIGTILITPESHKIVHINKQSISLIRAPKEQIIGRVCHSFICLAEKDKCPITDLIDRKSVV